MRSAARPASTAQARNKLLHLNVPVDNGFPQFPFPATHELSDHPLLTFEAIATLAEELPRMSIICDRADQPLLVPEGGPPRGAQPRAGELIRNIHTSNCWFTFLNIEQISSYRDLVDACLDEVESDLVLRPGDMRQRVGFVFVSSQNSVTPAHFDIEQSLLLQIHGSKTVSVGEYADSQARQREIDRYWDGSHGRLADLPREVEKFRLGPGDGLFLPAIVPHWVHNDGEPSLSITLTFFTRASQRHDYLQVFNAKMRRKHLQPRSVGRSPRVDRAKAAVVWAYTRGRRGIRPGQRYGAHSNSRYGAS